MISLTWINTVLDLHFWSQKNKWLKKNPPLIWALLWLFATLLLIINLGLSIYDILSLLTSFFDTKPSWITSPKLITMFLLFIHISYCGQLREGLIQLLIVCSCDIEVIPRPKTKSQFSFCHRNLNRFVGPQRFSTTSSGCNTWLWYYLFIGNVPWFISFHWRWKNQNWRLQSSVGGSSKGRCLYVL